MQNSNSILAESPGLLDKFESVQGMMSRLSGASFISVINHQTELGITGHILEFGVYKGRSAFLLAHLTKPSEVLYLIDINMLPEVYEIRNITPDAVIIETTSKDFSETRKKSAGLRKRARIIHIDGNHTFNNVAEDLEIAERLASIEGLIILDDFLNPNYPQVQAATFYHLYKKRSRLTTFLLGGNKAFLCNRKYHQQWIDYAVSKFADDMSATGHHVVLARTDSHPLFDAVYFRGRKQDEEPIYGHQLYNKYFPDD